MDIEKFKKLEKDIFLAFIGIVIFTVIGFLLQVVPVSPGFKNAF